MFCCTLHCLTLCVTGVDSICKCFSCFAAFKSSWVQVSTKERYVCLKIILMAYLNVIVDERDDGTVVSKQYLAKKIECCSFVC